MQINEMNLEEVEARLAEINSEVETRSGEELEALKAEVVELQQRKTELVEFEARQAEAEALNNNEVEPDKIIETREVVKEKKMSVIEERANQFIADGKLEMRQLLAAGVLTPTAVKETIGELPAVVSSIIDDVDVENVEGNGSYAFSFRITDAEAAAVTDGSAITGTPGSFNKNGAINPATVGVLDEISELVAQKTPIAYMNSIQSNAYLALRRKVKEIVTRAVYNSAQAEHVANMTLDEHFIRNLVLGYDSDESVAAAKLYICKEDLATLGAIRGTQDKKPVFEISYTDANNGVIRDGGLAVPFSINATLKNITGSANAQLYGDPKSVKLCLWGAYEVSTDKGGDYFKRNMIGIRGLQTAGADIVRKNGMQVVTQ